MVSVRELLLVMDEYLNFKQEHDILVWIIAFDSRNVKNLREIRRFLILDLSRNKK